MNTPFASPAEDADRILLVDDDVTNLDALRHTLDNGGYRLFVTRNGESAIEVARRVRPLLILLDVVMPGIDGYETCRRLKADPATREAAVVFLSSLDDTKDKVRGFEAGAVDFVSKPFQREEPGMEARDVPVDLDAVAGRQDHGLVDPFEVLEAPIGLREVVVGEREPLQQLDRRATERDPEGEDGHGRPIS